MPTPPPDVVAACAYPTATAVTEGGDGVGSPSAATIGPLTFHPYAYENGYPNKMIIYAARDQPATIQLRGSRCGDGRPLRFAYGDDATQRLPAIRPYAESRMQSVGDLTASLPATAANNAHTGYVLYSSLGRWEIAVSEGARTIGVLVVEVVES